MAIIETTEHGDQGVARLIAQYPGKPRLEALLRIYLDEVQQIEVALFDLATDRFLDVAIGAQLDGIGDIVGQERQGLSDVDYRPLLRARVQANRSEGTVPDIYEVAVATLDGSIGDVRIEQKFPAGVHVRFLKQLSFDEHIVNDVLQDAGAAGVRVVTVVLMTALVASFQFNKGAASFPTFDAAIGFDSAATPGTGTGSLARALDEQTG